MYCPKCGTQNNDGTKFCRACGENLKVISQAMTRRLPGIIANKLDAYLAHKNERIRRDSIVSGLSGGFFLLIGIRGLIAGTAGGLGVWFPIAVGCFLLLWSVWDYMVFKRSLSTEKAEKIFPVSTTNELQPNPHAQAPLSPASVTEFTTRHLDQAARKREKS